MALYNVPNRASRVRMDAGKSIQMLNVQRRHRPPCTRQEWDLRSCAGKGAKCPILIKGTLNGSRVQLSTAKSLLPAQARDFEAARALALEWERTGVVGRPTEYVPVSPS